MSSQVLQAVGDQWNVPKRYLDYHDLVAREDVDAVLVANPDAYHAPATLAAIAAGKHVLVEKPMCISLQEADAIIAAQASAGVTLQVGYMRRYAPAFVEACRLVPELGPIRLARVDAVIGWNSLFIKETSRVVRGDDVPADVLAQGKQLREERITEALGDAPGSCAMSMGCCWVSAPTIFLPCASCWGRPSASSMLRCARAASTSPPVGLR